MLSLHAYETISFSRFAEQNGKLYFQMVKIPFPDISSPKTQSFDLFCFSILNVHLCAEFGDLSLTDLHPTIHEKQRHRIRANFWAMRTDCAETTFHKETAMPIFHKC